MEFFKSLWVGFEWLQGSFWEEPRHCSGTVGRIVVCVCVVGILI